MLLPLVSGRVLVKHHQFMVIFTMSNWCSILAAQLRRDRSPGFASPMSSPLLAPCIMQCSKPSCSWEPISNTFLAQTRNVGATMQQELMRFGRLSLDQGQGINPYIRHIRLCHWYVRCHCCIQYVLSSNPYVFLGLYLYMIICNRCRYFYSNITHTTFKT